MRHIGRYQLRVRTLFFIPAIVALSWWLAVWLDAQLRVRADFQDLAALHANEALSYQKMADSPIRDRVTVFAMGRDGVCRPIESQLTEAEKMEERHLRERAGRRATYHRALRRKYAWAAWFPCLPIAPDPPAPE